MNKSAKAEKVTPSAWQRAADRGTDMSLLSINLKRTPAERLLAHDSALRVATELREAMGVTRCRT